MFPYESMYTHDFTFDRMMRDQVSAEQATREQIASRAILAYNDHGANPLKVDSQTRIDDNVKINYARTIVDKGVNFLFGNEFKVEINHPDAADADELGEESEADDEEAAEDYLDEVWPPDTRAEDFIDLATNGGQTGHVWAGISIDTVAGRALPRVVVLDPLNMSAVWDERDIRRVNLYRNQWNSFDENGKEIVRRQDSVRQENGTWVIKEYISRGADQWMQVGADILWRWTFAPVFQVKNLPNANVFYGLPDLTLGILRLNYYISRVDSMINKILRIHAHPKTVAYNINEDQLNIGIDGVLFVDTFEAELKNLEMQSDLTAAREFRKDLRLALAEISCVPEVATGKVENLGALSGRAMEILYSPLIEQTKKKRVLYGRMIKEVMRALLEIGGFKVAAKDVVLHWGQMLPVDQLEQAQVGVLKLQCGFSKDTVVQQLGGDPEVEKTKRADDAAEMGDALGKMFDVGAGDASGNTYNQTKTDQTKKAA